MAPLLIRSSLMLEDVTVKNSATGPQLSSPLAAESKKLSSIGNDGVALSITGEALVGLPAGGMFTGNAKNVIAVSTRRVGPALIGTVRNLGVPYSAESLGLSQDQDQLTIEAGTEFVFAPQAQLEIGVNNTKGKITAVGTKDKPIVFRGSMDMPGSWGGVVIDEHVNAESRFDYVTVRGAGMMLLSPLRVEHSSFSGSVGYGITKISSDSTDYAATNMFSDNATGDVGSF
jgi:hypothetical protein